MNPRTDSELDRGSLPSKLINLTHVFVILSIFSLMLIYIIFSWCIGLLQWGSLGQTMLLYSAFLPVIAWVPLGVMTVWHWAMGHFPPLRSVKRAVILSRMITLLVLTSALFLINLICTMVSSAIPTLLYLLTHRQVYVDPEKWILGWSIYISVVNILSFPVIIWTFGLSDFISTLLPEMGGFRKLFWALEDETFGTRVWVSVPLFKLFGHYVLVVDNRKYELRLPDRLNRVPTYSTASIDAAAFQIQQELEFTWTCVGWTRYSHAEIDQICEDIIGGFGTYNVYRRNCRHFLQAVWNRILHVGYVSNLEWLPYDKSAIAIFGWYCVLVCVMHLDDLFTFYTRCLLGKDWGARLPPSLEDIDDHLDEIRMKAIDMGLYFPDGRPSESPSAGPSGTSGRRAEGSNEIGENSAWLADFIEAAGPSVSHSQSSVVGSVGGQSTGGPRAYHPEEGQLVDIEMGVL